VIEIQLTFVALEDEFLQARDLPASSSAALKNAA
jgi:hypothetical protein